MHEDEDESSLLLDFFNVLSSFEEHSEKDCFILTDISLWSVALILRRLLIVDLLTMQSRIVIRECLSFIDNLDCRWAIKNKH